MHYHWEWFGHIVNIPDSTLPVGHRWIWVARSQLAVVGGPLVAHRWQPTATWLGWATGGPPEVCYPGQCSGRRQIPFQDGFKWERGGVSYVIFSLVLIRYSVWYFCCFLATFCWPIKQINLQSQAFLMIYVKICVNENMKVGLLHIETNGVKSKIGGTCESDILCLSFCLPTQIYCICKNTQNPLYLFVNGLNN